jgi:hypothetical protein
MVVPETEICLAFLLEDLTAGSGGREQNKVQSQERQTHHHEGLLGSQPRPRAQPVFAFLPLRTYGLRFVLQVCVSVFVFVCVCVRAYVHAHMSGLMVVGVNVDVGVGGVRRRNLRDCFLEIRDVIVCILQHALADANHT